MKNQNSIINFRVLTWPIFIEHFLRVIILIASYGLVSRVSELAAGVLGVANLYLLMGFSFVECLAQGSSIIINQYLGARKILDAAVSYVMSVWLNIIFGTLLSLIFICSPRFLLSLFSISEPLATQGSFFLQLVGSFFPIFALNYALLYILNANGQTKYSMVYSFLVNGIALFLYFLISLTPINFFISRIVLIAFTNIISRVLGTFYLIFQVKRTVVGFYFWQKISFQEIYKRGKCFIKITLPNALEPLSYQIFQLGLVKIISLISVESLSIRSYILSITTLFEAVIWPISKGNQIMIGHQIGAGRFNQVQKQMIKGIVLSLAGSFILVSTGIIFRYELMQFFSQNENIINVGSQLIFFTAFITILRGITFNLQSALKAAGDVRFGFLFSMLVMYFITIPGSYLISHFTATGLLGVWFMFTIDELLKILGFSVRWSRQRWKNSLVVSETNQ